ncbi:MAG TPA: 3-methyl-2-oxobutanoate hydroxymethyltransferase [Actinomycetota bacterium]|jgi:3-methyl-2-oxobutanoate hydroxymethyltransferase|nr:3-methyl-2-oxobutanoate hydroxymethyltransferase [Actinomycetota bacterium]
MTVSIHDLRAWRSRGERFSMVTAYDALSARICDEAQIPVLLVGDSLAQVLLGYETTLPVTMEEMLHHARAVARGARNALLVGDMPFGSYNGSREEAVRNASAFLKVGMHSVKLEGAGHRVELVRELVQGGIPVMGHLGLTPQFVNQFGGYRVQGRGDAGDALVRDAHALQEAGVFALVLECVPAELGSRVTSELDVPTIGIGAGPGTDGQVLVLQDLLGLTPGPSPRFVKRYADLASDMTSALQRFAKEVSEGAYPSDEHTYS